MRTSDHLLTISQGGGESLADYLTRFNREALTVTEASKDMTKAAFISGLSDEGLLCSIGKKPPGSLAELMERAHKYASVHHFITSRHEVTGG